MWAIHIYHVSHHDEDLDSRFQFPGDWRIFIAVILVTESKCYHEIENRPVRIVSLFQLRLWRKVKGVRRAWAICAIYLPGGADSIIMIKASLY